MVVKVTIALSLRAFYRQPRVWSEGESKLPSYGTWQLFFLDPNGAKVELDFDPAEQAPA